MEPTEENQKVFFIDAENVGVKGISGLLESKNHHVVLITGRHNKVDDIKSELANKRLDYIHTDLTKKELADKILLAKVGEYAERFPDRQLIIVSRDNDFKDAVSILNPHWDLNIRVTDGFPRRGSTKKDKPSTPKQTTPRKKTALTKQTPSPKKPPQAPPMSVDPFSNDARWRRVAARFVESEEGVEARKSITELTSFRDFIIENLSYTEKECENLIRALVKNGAISIKDSQIIWN